MKAEEFILWLDLETTGSELEGNHIIEVGWAITDQQFDVIHGEQGTLVVDPPSWPPSMDMEVVKMHTRNGLLKELLERPATAPQLSIARADDMMENYVGGFLHKGKIRLAGSGVAHFDLQFIRRDMPLLAKRIHYAPLDIGHVRRFMALCNVPTAPYEPKSHRALDDVLDHIKEAKWMLNYLTGYKS